MATDERPYLARLSRLFTDGIRGFLQPAGKEQDLALLSRNSIQPVILVGRTVSSDTQAFDEIVETNSRVKVTEEAAGASVTPSLLFDSGEVAGNVPTTVSLAASQTLKLEGMSLTYNADATAISRTMIMEFSQPWVAAATGVTNAQAYVSSTLTLTSGEDGGIHALPNGLEVVNDNGTITATANRTPFPLTCLSSVVIAPTITNGQAGDVYRFGVWGRRIA